MGMKADASAYLGVKFLWAVEAHEVPTHPVNMPCLANTAYQHTPCQYRLSIHTPCQHTLSIHPVNTAYQHTLSMHTINTPCQCSLSTHPVNTIFQMKHTLSTHIRFCSTHTDPTLPIHECFIIYPRPLPSSFPFPSPSYVY